MCGNPWVAMAINLADDAVFGMLDVAGGYKDFGEAAFDFGLPEKTYNSISTKSL
jgi:hypothetical protein